MLGLFFVADPSISLGFADGDVVIAAVGEELQIDEMETWLKDHHLWEVGLTEDQIERRYNVFSNMTFGDKAERTKADYMKEIVHMES